MGPSFWLRRDEISLPFRVLATTISQTFFQYNLRFVKAAPLFCRGIVR